MTNQLESGMKRLEEFDEALLHKVARIKSLVEGGEYDYAKIVCRGMEDDLQQANSLANRLADLDQ
jgi:hypothetical protein